VFTRWQLNQSVFILFWFIFIMPFCPECGKENTGDNKFCSYCGKTLNQSQAGPAPQETSPPAPEKSQQPPSPGRRPGPAPEPSHNWIIIGGVIVIGAIIAAGFFFGSSAGGENQNPGMSVSGGTPASPQVPAPTISGSAAAFPSATAGSGQSSPAKGKYTSSSQYGITLTYPADWEKEDAGDTAMRDYGRVTTNIANFYSPDISRERAYLAQPNIDTASYTAMSIDVDPEPVTEFDQYFNLVVIALQKYYGHIDITKHDYLLKISQTDKFQGYQSYQIDFDTASMRGSYIFTNVDGTIYVFAFKNPSPYAAEIRDIYKSIRIDPLVTAMQKHR
jgi:hypothetical protein